MTASMEDLRKRADEYWRHEHLLDRFAMQFCSMVPIHLQGPVFVLLGKEGDTSDFQGIANIASRDPRLALAILEDHIVNAILPSVEAMSTLSDSDARRIKAFAEVVSSIGRDPGPIETTRSSANAEWVRTFHARADRFHAENIRGNAARDICSMVPLSLYPILDQLGEVGDEETMDSRYAIILRDPQLALAVLEHHVRHDVLPAQAIEATLPADERERIDEFVKLMDMLVPEEPSSTPSP